MGGGLECKRDITNYMISTKEKGPVYSQAFFK